MKTLPDRIPPCRAEIPCAPFGLGRLGLRRLALLAVCSLGVVPGAEAQMPAGDYGDAPDDRTAYDAGIGRFPTKYATSNSRVGDFGVLHYDTNEVWLGASTSVTSAEAGATDPADPDGSANLPGADGSDGDAMDDGLIAVYATEQILVPVNADMTTPPLDLSGVVRVSAAAQTEAIPFYLNVLVDVDRNGLWRNRRGVTEWTTVNDLITVLPGTTADFLVDLGTHPQAQDVWVRITLTDTPVDPDAFATLGGWDGSGDFLKGETEDYYLTSDRFAPPPDDPGPEGSACVFKLRCGNDPLVLPHGQDGDLIFIVDIFDPENEGCAAELIEFREDAVGPLFGLGVQNGAVAGNLPNMGDVMRDDPVATPLGLGNRILFHFPIASNEDPPPRVQSFGVRARFGGYVGSRKIYGGSQTCGVLIFHDWDPHRRRPQDVPPFGDHGVGGNDVNFFATLNTDTTETLIMHRVNEMLPTIPANHPLVLPRYWIIEHHRPEPFARSGVINAFFQYDAMPEAQSREQPDKLRAARWDPNNFGDVNGFEIVGEQTSALQQGGTNVEDPPGFSIWIVGDDLDGDGVLDFVEQSEADTARWEIYE